MRMSWWKDATLWLNTTPGSESCSFSAGKGIPAALRTAACNTETRKVRCFAAEVSLIPVSSSSSGPLRARMIWSPLGLWKDDFCRLHCGERSQRYEHLGAESLPADQEGRNQVRRTALIRGDHPFILSQNCRGARFPFDSYSPCNI